MRRRGHAGKGRKSGDLHRFGSIKRRWVNQTQAPLQIAKLDLAGQPGLEGHHLIAQLGRFFKLQHAGGLLHLGFQSRCHPAATLATELLGILGLIYFMQALTPVRLLKLVLVLEAFSLLALGIPWLLGSPPWLASVLSVCIFAGLVLGFRVLT